MAIQFASGKKARGVCDICGFTYRLRELRNLIVKGRDVNVKACRECWSADHPQLRLGELPVYDPQALRNPRPDRNQYAQSRAIILPVRQVAAAGFIGTVTVTGGDS